MFFCDRIVTTNYFLGDVLINAKVIKSTVKTTLKGKWSEAVFASLQLLAVVFVIIMLDTFVLSVFNGYLISQSASSIGKMVFFLLLVVSSLLLLAPVFLGAVRWFWAFIIDKPRKISEIFYYYSSIKLLLKSVMLFIHTSAKVIVTAIFSFLPAACIYVIGKGEVLTRFGVESGDKTISALPLIAVFFIVGVLVFLKVSLRYSLSFVITVVNEKISPYEALILSRKITAKCRFSMVILFFEYLLWIAVSIFGITLLYTLPLLACSYVVTARILITNYCIDNKLERMNFC